MTDPEPLLPVEQAILETKQEIQFQTSFHRIPTHQYLIALLESFGSTVRRKVIRHYTLPTSTQPESDGQEETA